MFCLFVCLPMQFLNCIDQWSNIEHHPLLRVTKYTPFKRSLSLLSTSKGYSHSCQQVIIHVEWCLRLLLSPASASVSGPSRARKRKQTKYTQSSSSRRSSSRRKSYLNTLVPLNTDCFREIQDRGERRSSKQKRIVSHQKNCFLLLWTHAGGLERGHGLRLDPISTRATNDTHLLHDCPLTHEHRKL